MRVGPTPGFAQNAPHQNRSEYAIVSADPSTTASTSRMPGAGVRPVPSPPAR